MISHDQRFLDNVATHILDVDSRRSSLQGNYTRFELDKASMLERKDAEVARVEGIMRGEARLR